MLRFDIHSPIIPQDSAFYMLHPGKGYHLYKRFLEHSCVSTDLPNLELTDGSSPTSADQIDLQIMRARALRDWMSMSQADRKRTEYSTDLDFYAKQETRRFHHSYKETLIDLLWKLPEGAPIFVPTFGLGTNGFFCELGKATADRVVFNGQRIARDFTYAGRPVRNVKIVPMRAIPPEVLEGKNRNSILTRCEDDISERLLRIYYGSFMIEGDVNQTEIDVAKEVFRPADSNIINGIANFLEENLQKLEHENGELTSLVDALFLEFDEAELQIHAQLNSPGVVQVAAKTVAPLLLAFFIALPDAMSAEQVVKELKAQNVKVENTLCPQADEHTKLTEKGLFGILKMMGEDDITHICKRVKEFKARTGASVKAVVEEVDGNAD